MWSARIGVGGRGGRARGPPLRHGKHGRGALRTMKVYVVCTYRRRREGRAGARPVPTAPGARQGPESIGEFALQFLLYGLGDTSRFSVTDPLSVHLDDGIGPEGCRGEKDFFGGEELFDGEGTLFDRQAEASGRFESRAAGYAGKDARAVGRGPHDAAVDAEEIGFRPLPGDSVTGQDRVRDPGLARFLGREHVG